MKQYGYGVRNDRGQRLIDFALENKLTIINTCFKKKENRRWTWRSPTGQYKNEIDYIFSNQPSLFENIEVINLNYPSDHRPVRATLKLSKQKTNRTKFTNKQVSQLKNQNEINKYKESLKLLLSEPPINQENNTVQTHYDRIINAILQSLNSARTKRDDKNNHKILQERTIKLLNRRRELQKTKNKTRSQKNELSALYKLVNKNIKKDYTKHRLDTIERHLLTRGSSKKAYKELTPCRSWIEGLKNQDKNLCKRTEIVNAATEFYRKLYSDNSRTKENSKNIKETELPSYIEPINETEIINVIKLLKEEKSPGSDNITNEALKKAAHILAEPLAELFNLILKNSETPSQWKNKARISRSTFSYRKGSKTRRPTLPILFIAILENIIGKLDWRKLGLCIKGAYLNNLRFADDLVLLSETASEMQLMIETLHNSSTKVGLEMNLTKLSLTYGCQTWKFSTIATNKINTCQRGLERSMLKIKKLDKIRHTKIRETTKATNALTYAQKLKWKWAGHIARLTDQRWTSRVTRWTGPPGKRRPGRPLSRWEDDIKRTAGTNWRLVAQDRDKWKSLRRPVPKRNLEREAFDRLLEESRYSKKELICSLIVDEMVIRQQKFWNRKRYEGLVLSFGCDEGNLFGSLGQLVGSALEIVLSRLIWMVNKYYRLERYHRSVLKSFKKCCIQMTMAGFTASLGVLINSSGDRGPVEAKRDGRPLSSEARPSCEVPPRCQRRRRRSPLPCLVISTPPAPVFNAILGHGVDAVIGGFLSVLESLPKAKGLIDTTPPRPAFWRNQSSRLVNGGPSGHCWSRL
ncbi:Putative uncharacterized transposon-derived protein F52C9.6 [Eumeta japonica]|uniref:Uncharacterized transposon-derived protein F52C9.6 n=1 Tax=Eumeta variegata TaxID=151549 RepID=A0A4C1V909_EUMVA|nr:Putative uncharacterized transposon-derived protein F52C9.6 [Eumeta japonica]